MDKDIFAEHAPESAEEEYNRTLENDYKAQLKRLSVRLSKEDLEARIKSFLRSHCVCTLATCANNQPRSTIVRYRSQGLTIYILTEGGGKVKNIRDNPLVSVSVCGEYSGFQSVACLQLWGRAEIIAPDDRAAYSEAYQAMKIEERPDLKGFDVDSVRRRLYIVRISVERARYLSFPEGVLNQVLQVADP